MDIFAEFQERIERGIQFLDLVKPDWADLIDLEGFDLNSAHECVIGQVFPKSGWTGGYVYLERAMGYQAMRNAGFLVNSMDSFEYAPDHYRDCTESDCMKCKYNFIDAVDVMQDMWEYEIRQRQRKASV